jgi:hypothetical protein
MRRTRFMSVLFLVLAASYFAMPQFRQAIETPWLMRRIENGDFDSLRISQAQQWKADAESHHDAHLLAFIALSTDDMREATRLADLAVAADPKYAWVYYHVFGRDNRRKLPETLALAKKIQAFDPDNAVGYLMEAEHVRESNGSFTKLLVPTKASYEERFAQTEWRELMQKAYAAKKYDSYSIARFDLERHVLHEKGLDNPIRVALSLATYPIPNLLNIREYANLRTNYQGKNAADAGNSKEALDHYWAVARFGERMQLGSNLIIEQVIATSVQEIAYKPLMDLLRKTGETQSADSIQYSSDFLQRRTDFFRGKDILSQSATYTWNAILVNVFLGLTMAFAALTVLSILYVNVKRMWRAHKKGSLYGGITIAENYFPILLFIFSTGLYISYYPYARNFQHYMTAAGEMHDLESVFYNTISLPVVMPRFLQLSVGNPFVPYVWYALGAIAIVVAAQFLVPERKPQEDQRTTAASSRS